MRPLIACLLLVLILCSCEKTDTEVPAVPAFDVTGDWRLASSMTLPDSAWYGIAPKDSSFYSFMPDGQFTYKSPTFSASGRYKVIPDGDKLQLMIQGPDSLCQYLEVEQTNDSTIKVDDWLRRIVKGYTSRKYIRK